ncbi:hypothetical protein [Burkholderia cepacia]|uniref:hypothetical protein n=1 Tax=Burkholderia cepacia TaxID=292 RepID=UPI002FE01796
MNGEEATPADLADTIGWLASSDARHVTARIIHVNVGTERELWRSGQLLAARVPF